MLEHLQRLLRPVGKGGVVGIDLEAGVVAKRVQVHVQLADVIAHHAAVQAPVGGDRATQQQHRVLVDPIEHVAARDLVTVTGQLGVDPARLVHDGVCRAVRSGPKGQRPVGGNHVRERPPFNLRRVRRRLRHGRGRVLGAGHREHPAGRGCGGEDDHCGQRPSPPSHRATPASRA